MLEKVDEIEMTDLLSEEFICKYLEYDARNL
jgi:hypothetical protein